MRPKKETEFVVLKLMFLPRHGEIFSPAVESYDKIRVPPTQRFHLRDWYENVKAKEREGVPNGNRINYCMWQFLTHDSELFTVYNIRFRKLLAFIGEEKIHWIFYIHNPVYASFNGVTDLTLSYCRCCFNEQYMKFVESIHNDNQDPNCYLLS